MEKTKNKKPLDIPLLLSKTITDFYFYFTFLCSSSSEELRKDAGVNFVSWNRFVPNAQKLIRSFVFVLPQQTILKQTFAQKKMQVLEQTLSASLTIPTPNLKSSARQTESGRCHHWLLLITGDLETGGEVKEQLCGEINPFLCPFKEGRGTPYSPPAIHKANENMSK